VTNAHQWSCVIDGMQVRVTLGPNGLDVDLGPPGNPLGTAVNAICGAINVGLGKGVPLAAYLHNLKGQRFSPAGVTSDPLVPTCSSVVDYMARSLEARGLA